MRTQQEIDEEIKTLKEIKPKVRHYSMFHDDNWAKINAQVKVLEEKMTERQISDEWPDVEENPEYFDAMDAFNWMVGETGNQDDPTELPSRGWQELIEE